MTGIQNCQDTLTVFGWRLEKRTTVQGAIQTVLLVCSIIAAPIAMYYGFAKRLSDIERTQIQSDQKLTELNQGLKGDIGSIDARLDNLDARLITQERAIAVGDGANERTQDDIANLADRFADLDRFLRSYISTSSGPNNGPDQ